MSVGLCLYVCVCFSLYVCKTLESVYMYGCLSQSLFVCVDFVYVCRFVFVLLAVLFCLPIGMGIRRENTSDPDIEKHFIDITSEYLIGGGGGTGRWWYRIFLVA